MKSSVARQAGLLSFIAAVKAYGLARQDQDKAMAAAWAYGRLLWANPLGIYRDDTFEEALAARYESLVDPAEAVGPERFLHVISMPYATGGHTRLMEKLVATSPGSSDVLVTRPFVRDAKVLRVGDEVRVFCRENEYSVDELVSIIAGYRFVILHIHPDDIRTALAVGLARRRQRLRVLFVNHADHVFSFGLCSSDLVAEVSTFGFQLSQLKRQVTSSFLGIPVPGGDEYAGCHPFTGALHVVSAGSALKFKPSNGYSFPDLAMSILRSVPDARVTVIGPRLRDNYWWYLPKLLFPFRLRLFPVVPYPEYLRLVREASVYVDSMPMSGGTVLPEVRAQGAPVSGVLTGATGYTPFDETKFSDDASLVAALKAYAATGKGDIPDRNNAGRLLLAARENHALAAVGQRFRAMLVEGRIFQPIANIGAADVTFYEKQWQERSTINIDREVIGFVLGLPSHDRRPLLLAMARAMSWRQRFRLLFRFLRVALPSRQGAGT